MCAAIDPTGRRYSLFIEPIQIELENYRKTRDYWPTKRQLALFERNCAFLTPSPDLASIPRTSRERTTSARSTVQNMYEKLDIDLFVLCALTTVKTKMAAFDFDWISRLTDWWSLIPTPPRLSEVAAKLCKNCGLSYSPRKKGLQPQSGVVVNIKDRPGLEMQNQTVVNAFPEGIVDVFNEYMSLAIRQYMVLIDGVRVPKAAVTMEFPDFNLVDCAMMLEIRAEYVERLVKDLFGLTVETVRGVRHLVLGNGVRLTSNTSNPELTLKGISHDILFSIFGPEIYKRVKASDMYMRELQEGRSVTECVSMILMSRSGEGAYINICLDLKGGLEIKAKLYG